MLVKTVRHVTVPGSPPNSRASEADSQASKLRLSSHLHCLFSSRAEQAEQLFHQYGCDRLVLYGQGSVSQGNNATPTHCRGCSADFPKSQVVGRQDEDRKCPSRNPRAYIHYMQCVHR